MGMHALGARLFRAGLVLGLGAVTLACGGGKKSEPPPGLCPVDGAGDDLILCTSFSALSEGEIAPEVGSLPMDLEGDASLEDGPFGPCLVLDGDDDRASVPGFTLSGQALTVQAWVRPEGEQDDFATVVDFWTSYQGFWMGGSQPAGGWAFWTGPDELVDGDGLVQNEWQHLAGVYDGENGVALLYLNGIEVRRLTDVLPLEQPDLDSLGIGARGDRSAFFHGRIDELMIWAAVRSPEQVCTDAGGTYAPEGCDYAHPVGSVPDPCDGVTCSGWGTCAMVGGRPTCECEPGTVADGLSCLTDESPCAMIDADAVAWDEWYTAQIMATAQGPDLLAAAEAYAAEYVPTGDLWAPGAEAWTAVGQSGLMSNALEPFCLGFLRAAALDPDNPVALNNAATCMFVIEWHEDARRFLECSHHIAPHNASARAGLGYHEATANGDMAAALEHYQAAADLDPDNPEWAYQVMRIALDEGDRETADDYLDRLPAADPGGAAGWRGASSSGGGGSSGEYCCPCDGMSHGNLLECTNNCSANLSCFTGICAYTATCGGGTSALALGIKLCYPPSGVQVCLTFDTNGNVGFLVGASVFNGLLGIGAGFTFGTIDGAVNFVVDVGTASLPINAGSTWTVNLASGQVQGAVGLGNSSGSGAAQATIVTW